MLIMVLPSFPNWAKIEPVDVVGVVATVTVTVLAIYMQAVSEAVSKIEGVQDKQ